MMCIKSILSQHYYFKCVSEQCFDGVNYICFQTLVFEYPIFHPVVHPVTGEVDVKRSFPRWR